ncbi:restriction endonuclease [Pseudomonas sp. HMSC08G10]|uniref:restriction endonuclease subunit S n=1 Tax=Pseudomonas sp. HMSC08G10 TaxID=1581141 RepID=UPI0008A5D072|nr:restriction endonuclease subunit S [Pseudomonas sp. HMSC08G10]OFS69944.1 restriction endonuclease [Pseudomonas sp. HMSC08G10]
MSSEWQTTTFAEAPFTVIDGDRGANYPKQHEFTSAGHCLFLNAGNVTLGGFVFSDCAFITEEKDSLLRKGKLVRHDLVLTTRGTVGNVAYFSDEVPFSHIRINSGMVIFRPDQARIDPYYLYLFLRSKNFNDQVAFLTSGSAQPQLPIRDMNRVEMPLPPLEDQRKICSILRALDDRITLLRETNATLEAIAQALFKSWFVDFDPVRAKAEGLEPQAMDATTAALFPDSFEESELGLVPRGWAAVTMADVSTVGIGKTPPRKESQWFSEDLRDVRWVSIRDMGASGVYARQTSEYLTPEAVEKFNVRRIPDNTVLMSFKMTIGRVAITDGEMTTNEAIAHFRLDADSPLSAEYIYLHLSQFDFSRLSSTSSIADAVNSKTVREIPILVPGKQVAAAFQDQISTVFAILKKNEQQAQTLTQLRDTLLPRLISGQLRLPEAEQAVEEALA